MIRLAKKEDCCGCGACVQKCPKNCIKMKEDEEGFMYPFIDMSLCIDCHLCEKICPVINIFDSTKPLKVYAAINPNIHIRTQSSSGGIFTSLAETIIDQGGVVFGATFNEDWTVVHSFTDSKEGLKKFRTSKYVQSFIGDTFKHVESFLKSGRTVLFTGTPCQVSALNHYLIKHYDNLFTVDFICHGVPSPGVFRWYLSEEFQKLSTKIQPHCYHFSSIPEIPAPSILASDCGYSINSINFRDKKLGWKNYSFTLSLSPKKSGNEKEIVLLSSSLDQNYFLKGFLADLYLRPSCHSCVFRNLSSKSDITIGDFWGVENVFPEIFDNKGTSVVIINTSLGQNMLDKTNSLMFETSYQELCKYNSAILFSPIKTIKRDKFFHSKKQSFFNRVQKLSRISLYDKILYHLKRFVK